MEKCTPPKPPSTAPLPPLLHYSCSSRARLTSEHALLFINSFMVPVSLPTTREAPGSQGVFVLFMVSL